MIRLPRLAAAVAAGALITGGALAAGALRESSGRAVGELRSARSPRADGVQAFLEIVRVLQSPRCQNCHPAGDAPLQTDAGRPHAMLVTRGPEGRGVTSMKCSNCHMRQNNPQPHGPPGAPNWHLPPPETPMVFEGETPAEICGVLKDPAQNGGKDLEQLVHHMTADSLVLWGWDPGPGRTLPPLSQPEFARVVHEWADAGAPCP